MGYNYFTVENSLDFYEFIKAMRGGYTQQDYETLCQLVYEELKDTQESPLIRAMDSNQTYEWGGVTNSAVRKAMIRYYEDRLAAERSKGGTTRVSLFERQERKQMEDRLAKSGAEAERILQQAKAEAERILAAAESEKKEAAALKSEAEDALRRAQEDADHLRERTILSAQEEAKRQLEEEAEQELQRLLGSKMNAYMAQQRRLQGEALSAAQADRNELSGQTAALKEAACDFSNRTSSTLTQVMESAMEQMLRVKSEFNTALQQWKSDMYKCEYSPIISCFNSLLTLEKRFERDVAAEEGMTEEEVLTKLQQHSASMTSFRSRLERAMNAMGLMLYMPQSGEMFDAYYHTLDEDEDDESYDGRKIGECLSPGIIRKVNSEEETVMQRAVVTVQSAEMPRYMGFGL